MSRLPSASSSSTNIYENNSSRYNFRPRQTSASDTNVVTDKLTRKDVNKGTAPNSVKSNNEKATTKTDPGNKVTVKLPHGFLTWDSQLFTQDFSNGRENTPPAGAGVGPTKRKSRKNKKFVPGAVSPPISKSFTKSTTSPKIKKLAQKSIVFNKIGELDLSLPEFPKDLIRDSNQNEQNFLLESVEKGASSVQNVTANANSYLVNAENPFPAAANKDIILVTSLSGRKTMVELNTLKKDDCGAIEVFLDSEAIYKSSRRIYEEANSNWFLKDRVPPENNRLALSRTVKLFNQAADLRNCKKHLNAIFKRRTTITVEVQYISFCDGNSWWKQAAGLATHENPVIIRMSQEIVNQLLKNFAVISQQFQILNALTCPMEQTELVNAYRRVFHTPLNRIIRLDSVGLATAPVDYDDE